MAGELRRPTSDKTWQQLMAPHLSLQLTCRSVLRARGVWKVQAYGHNGPIVCAAVARFQRALCRDCALGAKHPLFVNELRAFNALHVYNAAMALQTMRGVNTATCVRD